MNENTSAADFLVKLSEIGDPTQSQRDWAQRFCDCYAQRGLIERDNALPLCRDCRNAADCWHDLPEATYPPPEQAGVSIPWVGSRYDETGICVLGINQNKYGGLGAHWWIRRGDMEERLSEGRGGRFYYGASCYIAAVEASIRGSRVPREIPPPCDVADAWLSSSFLEAIKCAPAQGKSQPTDGMWKNCAVEYLPAELALLAPRVLIVIGRSHAYGQLGDILIEASDSRPRFERWHGRVGEHDFDVLCCGHTSWPQHWRNTWPELVDSLEERPLGASYSA